MVFSIHRAMFDFAEHVDDASNVTWVAVGCCLGAWQVRNEAME